MMNNVTASGLGQRAHPGGDGSIYPFAPLPANTGLHSPMLAYLFDAHSAGRPLFGSFTGKLQCHSKTAYTSGLFREKL
jgi:hypothetical protein